MTEFLVQYERDPLAWVLYRSDAPDWLWQQVADNTGIPHEDDTGARDWVTALIKKEGLTDYTLSGPKPNEILTVRSEID
jgi:hypothetical protein